MSNLAMNDTAVRAADGVPCAEAPVLERIETRKATLGNDLVIRRAVPSRRRRMIGAWCFLDHAGPMDYDAGGGLRVGPHPHTGLQTLTWMIEGEVLHRDSLGFEQMIRPGQVNLMTAGRGIAHSEESPADGAGRLHTTQLWIALPDAVRNGEPAFAHHPDLPVIQSGGFQITLLAGEGLGESAPAKVYSPLVGLDIAAPQAAKTILPLEPEFEYGALVLEGAAAVEGETLTPGTLLYLGRDRREVRLATDEHARLLIIGGAPFEEDLLLWWNFVARTQEEVEQATADWNAGRRFGTVAEGIAALIKAPDLSGLKLKTNWERRRE